MKFEQLEKELVVFDLETTGIDIQEDRIIEIAVIRYSKDFKVIKKFHSLFNPLMEVSEGATEVHGHTNASLEMQPTFGDKVEEIYEVFKDADVVGYNSNRFDVPLLSAEMFRYGKLFPGPNVRMFDSMVIFKRAFPQNLDAAYHRYTGQELKRGKHNAMQDTQAVADIFQKQLSAHPDLEILTYDDLSRFCFYGDYILDVDGKLYLQNRQVMYGFGKHKDEPVLKHKDYAYWMFSAKFHPHTKLILALVLSNKEGNQLSKYMNNQLSLTEINEITSEFYE